MELEKPFLKIKESGENYSEVAFVAPVSIDKSDNAPTRRTLLEEIGGNIWGCDLMLCLFIAALNSYRADRCLRPFPQLYITEEGKSFNSLRNVCDSIPPLQDILTKPNTCTLDITKLLNWLFFERSHPVLKRISFNNVFFPSKINNIFRPHYVFEVCYQTKVEASWQKRIGGRNVIYAYHGSALDNFYSILKVGLQQHFSFGREVLFGNGIYLSTELSVSAHYSPFGQSWANSALGQKHSVIAVCEIINDIDKVKCQDTRNKRRSVNQNSLGEIPEKYVVVTDSDMVRIKYLMVYKEKAGFSLKSYITHNFFLFFIVFYIIVMFLISFFGNSYYMRYFRKLTHDLF